MRSYFLEGPRLLFSHWAPADYPLAADLYGDPQVAACVSRSPVIPSEEIHARLKGELMSQKKHGIQYWPVFFRETEDFVGCCGCRVHDEETKTVEMGFHLKSAYWGDHIGYEAAHMAVEYIFSDSCPYRAEQIWAGHHPSNERSGGLIRKLGFHFWRMEPYPPGMGEFPAYLLTRKEWEAVPKK